MILELMKGDSLEGSDDNPMFNPHIIPLTDMLFNVYTVQQIYQNSSDTSLTFIQLLIK